LITTTEKTGNDNPRRYTMGTMYERKMTPATEHEYLVGAPAYLSGSTIYPVSAKDWQNTSSISTYLLTVSAVMAAFAGIVQEPSFSGSTDDIRVDGNCVCEYNVDAAIGAALAATTHVNPSYTDGSALKNQVWDEDKNTLTDCPWSLFKKATTSDTTIYVHCKSPLIP